MIKGCLPCVENKILVYPDEFEIDGRCRCQDMSNADDEAIIYIVSRQKHGLGLLINAFGVYSEEHSAINSTPRCCLVAMPLKMKRTRNSIICELTRHISSASFVQRNFFSLNKLKQKCIAKEIL